MQVWQEKFLLLLPPTKFDFDIQYLHSLLIRYSSHDCSCPLAPRKSFDILTLYKSDYYYYNYYNTNWTVLEIDSKIQIEQQMNLTLTTHFHPATVELHTHCIIRPRPTYLLQKCQLTTLYAENPVTEG